MPPRVLTRQCYVSHYLPYGSEWETYYWRVGNPYIPLTMDHERTCVLCRNQHIVQTMSMMRIILQIPIPHDLQLKQHSHNRKIWKQRACDIYVPDYDTRYIIQCQYNQSLFQLDSSNVFQQGVRLLEVIEVMCCGKHAWLLLTYWGRVAYICVNKLVIFNCRRQAIIQPMLEYCWLDL